MDYQSLLYPDGRVELGTRDHDRLQLHREEDFRGARVLDVGCSSGMDLVWIASHFGPADVCGIDNDAQAIHRGAEIAEAWGVPVRLVVGDAGGLSNGIGTFDVVLLHAVARWIGSKVCVHILERFQPKLCFVESHSESDEWTEDLLRLLGLMGYVFFEQGRVQYTRADPRLLRIYWRGCRTDSIVKTMPPHRRLHLGLEMAILRMARNAGIPVPDARADGRNLVVGRIRDSSTLDQAEGVRFDRQTVGLVAVLDYVIGNCDVRKADGTWLEDEFKSPCYGDRHLWNMLWDGERVWYIDYSHPFAHLLWLRDPSVMTMQPFEAVVPETHHHVGYREIFQSLRPGEIREAIHQVRGVGPEWIQVGPWLDEGTCRIANDIIHRRVEWLLKSLGSENG